MRNFLLLLVSLTTSSCLYARNTDSLLRQMLISDDTTKIQLLVETSQLISKSNPDSALLLGKSALELSLKQKNPVWKAKSYGVIGLLLKKQKAYSEANQYYRKSVAAYRQARQPDREAAMLANIGIVYKNTGQYDSSLLMHLQALAIREKIGEPKELANSQTSTSQLYYLLEQYDKALFILDEAIKTTSLPGMEALHASALSDKGLIQYKISSYEEALRTFALAEAGYRATDDQEGLSFVYNNQAMVYQKIKAYDQAIRRYKLSLAIKMVSGSEKSIVNTLYNLGNTYYDQGSFRQAVEMLENARVKAENIYYREGLVEIYDMLAKSYEAGGGYRQALHFRNAHALLADSMFNENLTNQIAEMEVKYETEKKARALADQSLVLEKTSAESLKNQQQRNMLVVLLLLLGLSIWLLYSRLKYKQRAASESMKRAAQETQHRAILEAEEKERVRIARELHDGIGQQMAALKLNLGLLSDQLPLEQLHKEKMNDLVALADDASRELRTVSHAMMPNALIRAGLTAAVREFLQRIGNDRIKIDFEVIGLNERLEHAKELAIFRVMQECVSNILKHAKATSVSIQLIRHDDELSLLIEDNGIGFDAQNSAISGGIGLKNIKSRLEDVGGEVDFDSQPEHGTTVNIRLPL